VPDLDVLVAAMRESLSELLETTRPDGGRPLRRVPRKVT
jgi:hypothetical protein